MPDLGLKTSAQAQQRPRQSDQAGAGDAIAQSIQVPTAGEYACLRVLEAQMSFLREPIPDCSTPAPHIHPSIAKDEQIVNVANVTGDLQIPLDEVIEVVQINLGREELTRRGADRQTAPGKRPSVVEPGPLSDVPAPIELGSRLEDAMDHLEKARIAYSPGQQLPQDVEIDARKVPPDIEVEREAMPSNELEKAQNRPLGPESLSASVGIVYKTWKEDRFHDQHQRVVDNPVSDRGTGDEAQLGSRMSSSSTSSGRQRPSSSSVRSRSSSSSRRKRNQAMSQCRRLPRTVASMANSR